MLISPAYAQTAGAGGPDLFMSLLPLVLIFVVFYFLLIRPQQRKVKEHREMVAALKRGDRVLTAGGIIGQVVRVEDDSTLMVEIAKDVRVKVARATITEVLSKPVPAAANEDRAKAANAPAAAGGSKVGGLLSRMRGK